MKTMFWKSNGKLVCISPLLQDSRMERKEVKGYGIEHVNPHEFLWLYETNGILFLLEQSYITSRCRHPFSLSVTIF